MDINEIQDLIKFVAKAGVNEVEIEKKDFKIVIKSDYLAKKKTNFKEETTIVQQQIPMVNAPVPAAPAAAPVAAPAVAPLAEKDEVKQEDNSNLITVKAQMIGTFYRAAGPDKDPFIQVGSVVKPGDKLCIIEAMKLFNEIEAEEEGVIEEICVANEAAVEYGQTLFLIKKG